MQILSLLCGLKVCCEPHSIFRRHCHTAVQQNQHAYRLCSLYPACLHVRKASEQIQCTSQPCLWLEGLLLTMMHTQHKCHLTRNKPACQPCLWLEVLLLGVHRHCSPMNILLEEQLIDFRCNMFVHKVLAL